jgi:methylamine dehydrogenase heavy chain
MRTVCEFVLAACVVLTSLSVSAAEVSGERGGVAKLGMPQPHWFLLSDMLGVYVFDGDTGDMKGKLDASAFTGTVVFDRPRARFYVPGSFYSRQTYGERTDVVVFSDVENLAPVSEVEIPKKLAAAGGGTGLAALVEGRFLGVYNMTPAMSVSIVDVETARFVGEIETPGCAFVLPVAQGFLQICGDGTLQRISIGPDGRETARVQSKAFFDVMKDPVYDRAAPTREGWLFVSFDGKAFEARSGAGITVSAPWSLVDEKDREEKWRIGGRQPFAVNPATGTLVALMHQGETDTHEDDGTEIWGFDLATKRRGYRIALEKPAHTVEVTADAEPLLFVVSTEPRKVLVYDARTGRLERTIEEAGLMPGDVQRF